MVVKQVGNKYAVFNKKDVMLARFRSERDAELYEAKKFPKQVEKPKKVKKQKEVKEDKMEDDDKKSE